MQICIIESTTPGITVVLSGMGKKEKKEEVSDEEEEGAVVEVGPFCQPLAEDKLAKKLFKCIKKGPLPC